MATQCRFQARNVARCWRVLFATGVLLGCFQTVALAASPVGLWYAEGGAAEVEIRPCSDGLCGKIVWLRSPIGDDGSELRDEKNPDHLRAPGQSSGWRFSAASDSLTRRERNGQAGRFTIRPAARTYSCNARLDGDDRLFLRGYFGIQLLGRTTTWTRVGAERQCKN